MCRKRGTSNLGTSKQFNPTCKHDLRQTTSPCLLAFLQGTNNRVRQDQWVRQDLRAPLGITLQVCGFCKCISTAMEVQFLIWPCPLQLQLIDMFDKVTYSSTKQDKLWTSHLLYAVDSNPNAQCSSCMLLCRYCFSTQ